MRSQGVAHTRQLPIHVFLPLCLFLAHLAAYPAGAHTAGQPGAACSLAQAVNSGSDCLLPTTHNKQRLIAEQPNTWAHHFTLQAAVQLDGPPTAFAALRGTKRSGSSSPRSRPHLVALGDASGRLYFFTPQGYLLFEHDAGVAAAVLAIHAAPLTFNTTLLAVGYSDGTLTLSTLTHRPTTLMHTTPAVVSVLDTIISTAAEREGQYAARRTTRSAVASARARDEASSAQQQQQDPSTEVGDGSSSSNSSTEASGQARNTSSNSLAEQGTDQKPHDEAAEKRVDSTHVEGAAVRHIRFVRLAGQQAVLLLEQRGVGWLLGRSNGRVRLRVDTPPNPLGLQASDHQAVVIHPQGITISWMRPGRSLIRPGCRGLSPADHCPVVAVAFDTIRQYKAYLLTASGELLTMVVPFGKQTHICRVVSKMQLGLPAGAVALHSAHQRLLLVHSQGAAWLSLPPLLATAGALTPLVSTRWGSMWGLYGLGATADGYHVGGGDGGSDGLHESDAPVLGGSQGVAARGDGVGEQGLAMGGVRPGNEGQGAGGSPSRVLQGAADPEEGRIPQQEGGAGVGSSSEAHQQWVLSTPALHSFMGSTAGPLVVLPLGRTSVALFADGGACGGVDSSSSSAGSARGGGGGDGEGINWGRFMQPLLIVMMIVVAVWQFMRASNKTRYTARDSMGGLGRFDPSGFDQDPAAARLRALTDTLGHGGGGVDRDMLDRLDARLGRMEGRVGAAAPGGGGGLRYREGAVAAAGRGAAGFGFNSNSALRDVPEY